MIMESVLKAGAANSATSTRIVIWGLALGLLADLLFGDLFLPGAGFACWLALFGSAGTFMAYRERREQWKKIAVWSVVAVSAAGMLIIRTSPVVVVPMAGTLIVAAAMVIMEFRGTSLINSTVANQLAALLRVPLQALAGILPHLGGVNVREGITSPKSLAISRGVIIVLPLVIVFGGLFSQADVAFERLTDNILGIFSPELPRHAVTVFVMGWLAGGMLAIIHSRTTPVRGEEDRGFILGPIETLVVIGVLTSMFLVFVCLQLPYLFGGRETIAATSGLTLAQYARRGFFELVWVAVLTLATLIVLARSVMREQSLKIMALVQIACVFIILLSATQRLYLYTESFGLTLSRLAAVAFMLWLIVCLLLFSGIILRGRVRGFALGMNNSAIVAAFILALLNPPRFVADFNLEQARAGGRGVDYQYLMGIGVDSIPVLLDNMEMIGMSDRCMLAVNWLNALDSDSRFNDLKGLDDWRTWNLVRARARDAILENTSSLTELRDETCPQLFSTSRALHMQPLIFQQGFLVR